MSARASRSGLLLAILATAVLILIPLAQAEADPGIGPHRSRTEDGCTITAIFKGLIEGEARYLKFVAVLVCNRDLAYSSKRYLRTTGWDPDGPNGGSSEDCDIPTVKRGVRYRCVQLRPDPICDWKAHGTKTDASLGHHGSINGQKVDFPELEVRAQGSYICKPPASRSR